jgi:hypothetical protein
MSWDDVGPNHCNMDGTPKAQPAKEPSKRGPKPRPPETLASATRKNVSLDAEAQQALSSVAEKLERKFGFRPTLTQTVLWLASRTPEELGE